MYGFYPLLFKHLPRSLFSKSTFKIKIGQITLHIQSRTSDMYAVKEIIFDRCYYPTLVSQKQLDIKTVVDLGAHLGIFTVWAAKEFNPDNIIAVEPNPKHAHILEENLKENGIRQKVQVIEKAIYFKTTNVGIKSVPFNPFMTRIDVTSTNSNIETVEFKTLVKDIKTVDLLKMDIEGAEQYILNDSNTRLLRSKVKYIVMESHTGWLGSHRDNAEKFLTSIGFRCKAKNVWYNPLITYVESVNPNLAPETNG